MRKIGVTSVDRKFLVALWQYIERDELPAGTMMKD